MYTNIVNNISNKKIREHIFNLASQYADENNLSVDQVMSRVSDLYAASGKPVVKQTTSFLSKLVPKFDKTRAHMNPFGRDKLYNINTFDDLVAELSHSYNFKNLGWFGHGKHGLLKGIAGKYYENYETPGYTEYNTHQITEPLLKEYISGNISSINELTGQIKSKINNNTVSTVSDPSVNYADHIKSPVYDDEITGKVVVRHPGETQYTSSGVLRSKYGGLLKFIT